ncbi:phage terminase large subunit [Myxococcus landrumensis]|uniref:Phage terminase large subunit n=1 Tax=Myxococcus landrumensis TaxID=2813577 RepID=A0ABX7N941_9BACT|nr:phage terminase large subunit [Myxococcus landrumus]QSQ14059.1 phage terminase large subunit [Myxococcus landrumus]
MTSVAYKAPPTLARFMRSGAFVRCCVGPVGSGKSSAAVVEIVRRAAEQAASPDGVRRTRFAVIRNTYRELKDTTRKTFEQWVPAETGKWHEQDFTFTLDKPLKDGTRLHCEVLFRALDRPEHVKKLLSLELTGAYVNEARQVPKAILDVLCSRVGRYPSKAQGGATWFGVWMDTNPWHTGHWGYKLFSKTRPEGYELYEQPGGRAPDAENLENLPPGYYERQVAGKDSEWIAEYIDSKYPSHDKGSIYGDLLAALEARGSLLDFAHDGSGTFTTWDLGRADSTSIWWWSPRPGGAVDVLEHYRNNGEPLSHYFGVLDERASARGYKYRKHVLPHDARAKTLVTRSSVLEQFLAKYGAGAVTIGPQLSVEDGIAAARALLEGDIRFHVRCDVTPVPGLESGLEALRNYRYAYDERLQTFKREPMHDWASHDADAFRYLATFAQVAAAMSPQEVAKRPADPTAPVEFRLDDLWDTAPSRGSGRSIA